MDRPREAERGATFLMVPQVPSDPVRVVNMGGGRVRYWRWATAALATLVVVLGVALALAMPRANAYTSMLRENFELKARLDSVERKMGEIDRILLRLRLYDAQLESLGSPRGGSGPVEGSLDSAVLQNSANVGLGDGWVQLPWATAREPGQRPAAGWASGVEQRAESIVGQFESIEPDLTVLVEEFESLEALGRALPSFWPAAGFLTSGFGWRRDPLGMGWRHHSGIDIGGQIGDPIWAAAAGTVQRAGTSDSYGKLIVIDHGFGVTTHYAHCSRILVRTGQRVRRGQQLGLVGNTGRSTGPHLHFEVRLNSAAVDPQRYLPSRRSWLPPWRTVSGD